MKEWIYRRLPAVLMARRNLSRAKVRTILAIVCIVIGVAAIGSMGLFGAAFRNATLQNFGDIGDDVQVQAGEDNPALTDEDLRDVERAAPGTTVIPVERTVADVRTARQRGRVQVYGIDDAGRLYEAEEGRIPENWRRRALVGASLADQLDLEPGDSIEIDGETYRVAAVLEEQGFGTLANPDFAVVLPAERVETDSYDQFIVRADSRAEANATAQRIDTQLNGREQRVQIREQGQIAEQVNQLFAQLNLFLIGIGGISLLVAAISILNVQLMAAIERREEIGVLRAVGFQKLDIMRVMLTEAATLGVAGSVVGVGLSLLVGLYINNEFLGTPFAFDSLGLSYVAAAFVVGVIVSVVSGLYPAWKAANARPVEALRN